MGWNILFETKQHVKGHLFTQIRAQCSPDKCYSALAGYLELSRITDT